MRAAAPVLFGVVVGFLAWAGGPLAAAPVPKHLMKEAENPDRAALQGKWTLTRLAVAGAELTGDTLAQLEMTLEVRGDAVTITLAKQNMRSTAKVKLDAATNPRRMRFTDGKMTDLDGKPVEAPGGDNKMGVAIYKIEGDTFVMAAKSDGKDGAPEDFTGKAGSDTAVLTFTRVKK